MTTLFRRMRGAAVLHADTYEEVEADTTSLSQATLIVVTAALVAGAARALQSQQLGLDEQRLMLQTLLSVLEPLVLWIGGSAFAFMVGATFFRGPETETDFLEVLRTTGFAFTPALCCGGSCSFRRRRSASASTSPRGSGPSRRWSWPSARPSTSRRRGRSAPSGAPRCSSGSCSGA